jgi:general secretion pathway protein D
MIAASMAFCPPVLAMTQSREPVKPPSPKPDPPPAPAQVQKLGPPKSKDQLWTYFAQEQDLTELIDVCSVLLGVSIQYNKADVAGPVALRLTGPVSEEALWDLANRALAAKGFTSVEMPESNGALNVVQLAQAPSLARLQQGSATLAKAGFAKVLIHLVHDRTDGVAEAIKLVLSKNGAVTAFKDTRALLVTDLTPHVREAERVATLLDGSYEELNVEEVRLAHTTPVALVALLERIANAKKAALGEKQQKGTVLANAEGKSVLILAPAIELDVWRDLVKRFDKSEPLETLNYMPHRFGVLETGKLINEVVQAGAKEEGWRMVTDELTGTLVITATPSEHKAIQELLTRLESTAQGPRRPMRSFAIKHRGVEELKDLLQAMLDAGALKGAAGGSEGEKSADKPKDMAAAPPPPAQPGSAPQGPTAPLVTPTPVVHALSSSELGEKVILTADKATNRLIAMGEGRVLEQLAKLIDELDVRTSQVLVEALVLGLTDDETHDLGVEIQKLGTSGSTQFRLASLFGLGVPDAAAPSLLPATGTGLSGVVLNPGDYSALLHALETVNKGRTLTVPKVLVNNNQPAQLNSVLQTPYASTNASTTVATTSYGGTLDAGTQINVTPQIADGDQLLLEYSVSISEFVGSSADPALPPPRQENKLKSSVTVPDGYTVVLGGLDIKSESDGRSQVPILGDIPVLGFLFRNRTQRESHQRFFIFLHCSVLRSGDFDDLKYASETDLAAAELDDGFPRVGPRVIR